MIRFDITPIELTTLSREWTPTDFPRDLLVKGTMPNMTINGVPAIILEQSVKRICEPPQIWLTLMDEKSGRTYMISLEDDDKSGVVSARVMVRPCQEGHHARIKT